MFSSLNRGSNKNGKAAAAASPFSVFAEANFLFASFNRRPDLNSGVQRKSRACTRLLLCPPDAHSVKRPVNEDERHGEKRRGE